LPLTQRVTFKVQLQNQNRFQVPKVICWHYKLDASQILKVTLMIFNLGFGESFLGKMLPDGRITVPRLVIVEVMRVTPHLKAYFIEVTLEPV
jgi:hypothetical protein